MVAASALNSQIGWAEESTYGTFVAATEFHELISESIALDIARVESQGIRTGRRTMHLWKPGTRSVEGDIEVEVHPVGIGLLLKHAVGNPTTTGAGPYTHTYDLDTLDDKSLSIVMNRPTIAGADDVFAYVGCQITSWELSAAVDEFAKFKASFYGRDYDAGQAKGTASYPAGDPFCFTQGSVSVAGSDLPVESFTLSVDNALTTGRHRIQATNPALPRQAKESGYREITGTLTLGEHVAAEYDRFVAGTDVAIVVALDDGTNSLTVTMNARIDQPSGPSISGPDLLTLDIPFKAYHSTSDDSAFTAVLVNNDATV